jgi:hypothetical protein
VAIFSGEDSAICLMSVAQLESNDEWPIRCRWVRAEGTAELAMPQIEELTTPLPTPLAA